MNATETARTARAWNRIMNTINGRGHGMNMSALTNRELHFLNYRRDLNEMELDAVYREIEYRDWMDSPRNTVESESGH
jgi:hypothetical protein